MKRFLLYGCLGGIFFLQSCKKDVPPQRPEGNVTLGQGGVFVLNEGNYTFGNAKKLNRHLMRQVRS